MIDSWNYRNIGTSHQYFFFFLFFFFFRQTHSKFKMTNRENWRAINTEVNCCSIPSEIVFCNNFYFDPILRFLQGQNYIKFHLLKWQILMSELQEFDDWYNIHSQFRFGQLLPIINDVLLQLLSVTVAVIYKKGLSLKFAKPRVAN